LGIIKDLDSQRVVRELGHKKAHGTQGIRLPERTALVISRYSPAAPRWPVN